MSSGLEPRDPDYERRVLRSFARQGLLATFAARLETIEPGMVEIHVPFSTGLTQQDCFYAGSFMPVPSCGFFHAGVGIFALENACCYAALTLMAPATRVLTVKLKVNLLSPAVGRFLLGARRSRPARPESHCLARRLPGLRLAVPPEKLSCKEAAIHGMKELAVAW